MSHLKERKEPTCLNCQTSPLYGRYCHVCGQENLEPKETVWHLVQHFFNDITHFDGKFFSTVRYLIRRPGFLSTEYVKGRRASYLNPIRMYVFTSAIFFIVLFSLPSSKHVVSVNETSGKGSLRNLHELRTEVSQQKVRLITADSGDRRDIMEGIDRLNASIVYIERHFGDTSTRRFSRREVRSFWVQTYLDSLGLTTLPADTRKRVQAELAAAADTSSNISFFGLNTDKYANVKQYDSVQNTLPDSSKDGWFKHLLTRRFVNANQEFRDDKEHYNERLIENFLHSFPKILFFSLPFFALILRLLYVRRKILYVEHGIFTIHVYCATFIATLALVLINQLVNSLGVHWLEVTGGILIFALWVYMLFYLYKSMRVFYRQRRFKTILKYLLLLLMALIVNTILLLLFFMISAISV